MRAWWNSFFVFVALTATHVHAQTVDPASFGVPSDGSPNFTLVNAHRMWAEGYQGEGVGIIVNEGLGRAQSGMCGMKMGILL